MNQILKINFFLLFIGTSVAAQNLDPKAKSLLSEVKSTISGYKNVNISFKYVLENEEENIYQETKGEVTLKDDKYVLEILGVKRIFDGNNLYTISLEDEEVTISSYKNEIENTITPNNLLSFFDEGYNYKLDILQNKYGIEIQYIKLTPIDSNSEIKYVLLGIDTNSKHIYNLIEIGKNNTRTTLTVLNFKFNIPLLKSFFSFTPSDYPTFYINKID
tara:strand:- start:1118 stop:1768 length:651 start_codon:yes stop_codon:yes gene_type:complete